MKKYILTEELKFRKKDLIIKKFYKIKEKWFNNDRKNN